MYICLFKGEALEEDDFDEEEEEEGSDGEEGNLLNHSYIEFKILELG